MGMHGSNFNGHKELVRFGWFFFGIKVSVFMGVWVHNRY